MDPVSLIVGALAAGVGDVAKAAVQDAYDGLKRLLAARFAGRAPAEVALAHYEADPQTWRPPLAKELADSGAAADPAVLAAARAVLELVDPAGARTGKYQVDLSGAQGVQVGEHNSQVNLFGPAGPRA